MKQTKGLFRRQLFGGFRRKDVLEYIDELSGEAMQKQARLEEQESRMAQYEARIREYEAMVMQYEEQVKELNTQVDGLREEARGLQEQVSGLTGEVSQLRGEQERLQEKLREHQAETARRHEETESRTRRMESRLSELSSLNESLSRQVESLASRPQVPLETPAHLPAGESLEFSIGQMLLEAQKAANRIVESARGEAELIGKQPEQQESVFDEFSELRRRIDELKSGMQSTLGHLVIDLDGAAEKLDGSLFAHNQ